jgi:hypothetical protein
VAQAAWQPTLYTVEASIVTGSHLHDTGSKKIGNQKSDWPVIWIFGSTTCRSSSMAPSRTAGHPTSVYDRDKMDRMLQLAREREL